MQNRNINKRIKQIEEKVRTKEHPVCVMMQNPGESEEELQKRVDALHDDNMRRCGRAGVTIEEGKNVSEQ